MRVEVERNEKINEFLSAHDISGGDPLAARLPLTLRSALWGAALMFGFGLIYMIGLAALSRVLMPRAGIVASMDDRFNQINFGFIFPFIAFYYLWQPERIARTYRDILAHVYQKQLLNDLQMHLRRLHANPLWWQMGILFAALGMAAGTYDNFLKLGKIWYAANWGMIAGLQLFRGFIFYFLFLIVSRHLAFAIGLRRLFQHVEIPLITGATDHVTEIRSLGDYALSFLLVVAVVGLNIGLGPLLTSARGLDYPYQVAIYLTIAPLSFFLPMWRAHLKMKKTKEKLLEQLTGKYQRSYQDVLANLNADDARTSKEIEELKSIHDFLTLVKSGWSWPFNAGLLGRAVLVCLSPLVPLFLDYVVRWVIRLLFS